MGESFDHCPAGWIRQSRKCCTKIIHNHMVVGYLSMSSVNFAIPDFCSLIPVGSLGLSRRVRNRRVTHRPWLVMGSRLVERKFQNCFRLAGKPEVRKVVQHNWDRLTSSDSRAC